MTLNEKDYNRLVNAIKQLRLSALGTGNVKVLAEHLKSANIVQLSDTPSDLVTMNSRFVLERLDINQSIEMSVVYHDDADVKEKRVSVFAPMGMAFLGKRENDVVSCTIPNGNISYRILKILYQPEACGDLHL